MWHNKEAKHVLLIMANQLQGTNVEVAAGGQL